MNSSVPRPVAQACSLETARKRLRDIAEYLGVSEDEAVAYAINKAWEYLDEHEDMRAELEFKRYGRKVGNITYLNCDEAFLKCVQERIDKGIPLPHEDDDTLEANLLFRFLTTEQQAQVRSAADPMQKRALIAEFLRRNEDEPLDTWNPAILNVKG